MAAIERPPESGLKPLPKVHQHGRCYVCNKDRPPLAVKVGDPFCSAVCSRVYFKTTEETRGS